VFVSVVGAESATFQKYVREEGNRARRRQFKNRGKDEPTLIEEEEETLLKAVVACMTGWRTVTDGESEPVIIWDKRKLEFSADTALKWIKQFRWVGQQVNAATADLGNFIKA
jgi:hypothetical protein